MINFNAICDEFSNKLEAFHLDTYLQRNHLQAEAERPQAEVVGPAEEAGQEIESSSIEESESDWEEAGLEEEEKAEADAAIQAQFAKTKKALEVKGKDTQVVDQFLAGLAGRARQEVDVEGNQNKKRGRNQIRFFDPIFFDQQL